jgi:hypothetical protein
MSLWPSAGSNSGLRLVLLLALTFRVALLLGNIADHPRFFFQDLGKVEAEISSAEEPYMNAFGFEASNIAHAWVCAGQGFASPFGGSTGPTAWIAPGVVALYAVSFSLWGCFTFESILFVFGIALVVSLVTTVVVFHIGCRVGSHADVGFLAALCFALLPYEAWIFQISGHLDFNLQVLWLAVLLLAVLRATDRNRRPSGFEFGAVSSVAAIFNPGFLLCSAVGFIFAIRGRSRRGMVRFVLLAGLAHVLILGPVVAVQSFRLGGFVPVKSNAGFEIFLGDTPEARGLLHDPAFQAHHPSQNAEEFARYSAIGELRYVEDARQKFAESFVLTDFLCKFGLRTYHFFLGYQVKSWDSSILVIAVKAGFWLLPTISLLALLAARRGRLDAAECVMVLVTLAYAAPYLVTGVMERYRIPMVSFVAVTLALVTRSLIESRRKPIESQ